MLNYLFPRVCHLCGLPLGKAEECVCTSCLAKLPRTLYHQRKDNGMEQRFMGLFPFERATGHFFYSRGSELASLITDLKYRHFRKVGRMLGRLVGEELFTTGFMSDIDMLIPVPMHFLKQAQRGYNQVDVICKGLSETTLIPVSHELKAVKRHRTQTSMTLEQRRANTSGIFRVKHPAMLDRRHILLVDDVCTTGSTLTSAAETILAAAPTARISLLTLGVTF